MNTGFEIDRILRWPAGKAIRLARKNKLPHYVLPNGEIRFRREEILSLIIPAGPLPAASVLLASLPETAVTR